MGLKPFGFAVSAADAYRVVGRGARSPGPIPGVLIAALEIGDVELLGDALFNDLQPGVVAHGTRRSSGRSTRSSRPAPSARS